RTASSPLRDLRAQVRGRNRPCKSWIYKGFLSGQGPENPNEYVTTKGRFFEDFQILPSSPAALFRGCFLLISRSWFDAPSLRSRARVAALRGGRHGGISIN